MIDLYARARDLVSRPLHRYVHRPRVEFGRDEYQRLNHRRLEHLASLGLPLEGRSVLEVGAGIGDHTAFFLDRGCSVTSSDGRAANVRLLRRRHAGVAVRQIDLDPPTDPPSPAELVYCYGTLYHLREPAAAIAYLAACTRGLLLMETCVSAGEDEAVNVVREPSGVASQAVSGFGCRPTRPWVVARLAEHFEHVYVTVTQPWHEQFPLDWSATSTHGVLTRAVFVASRSPLDLATLTGSPPQRQLRH